MKGLVLIGVCAMNMFGLGTSTAQNNTGETGEHISAEISNTECLTQVNDGGDKVSKLDSGNQDTPGVNKN